MAAVASEPEGPVQLVKDLLAAKASVHPANNKGATALILAAGRARAGAVRELLAAKASTEDRITQVAHALPLCMHSRGRERCV